MLTIDKCLFFWLTYVVIVVKCSDYYNNDEASFVHDDPRTTEQPPRRKNKPQQYLNATQYHYVDEYATMPDDTMYSHSTPSTEGNKLLEEEMLLEILFRNYNHHVLPREFNNQSLKLSIGLAMIQLINIYDKEQYMKANVWLHLYWKDFQLSWTHLEEFRHIKIMRVPFTKVWNPDIILFNNALGRYDTNFKCNLLIFQEGEILFIPPAIYKSTCQTNVRYFPFDQQVCEMIFGSWVYNSDELNLDYFEDMRHVDLNDYVPSGTWDIVDVPANIEYNHDTTTNKTRVRMVYRITMRRKGLFYIVNLIVPTFLLSVLAVCVFYLPTGDGKKITLSLSTLTALVFFFLLIAKILPPTSIVVPLISKYLLFTFTLIIMSIFNTCIVINHFYRKPNINPIHPWMRIIFIRILPELLFMKRPKPKIPPKGKKQQLHPYGLMPIVSDTRRTSKYVYTNDTKNDGHISPLMFNSSKDDEGESYYSAMSSNDDEESSVGSYQSLPPAASPLMYDKWRKQRQDKVWTMRDIRKQQMDDEKDSYLYCDAGRLPPRPTLIRLNAKSNLYNLNYFRQQQQQQQQNGIVLRASATNLQQQQYQSTKSLFSQNNINNRRSDGNYYEAVTVKPKVKFRDPAQDSGETLIKTCKSVEYISNIIKAKTELEEAREDWKYIASVMDRLMLIIFFIVTCIGTYSTLFDAPYLFEEVDQREIIRKHSNKLKQVFK